MPRFLFLLVMVAIALAWLPGAETGLAQTGKERVGTPIPLRPGTGASQDQTGAPAAGGVQTERATTGRRRPIAVPRIRGQGNVKIGKLKAYDPSSIGLLTDADGGLGMEMWTGSRQALIKELMPQLPMGTTSPVMQSLARRLLLTVARVPKDEGSGPSLLTLRIDRLAAGGRLSDINDLLQQAPAGLSDSTLIRTRMNGYWLAGKDSEACALALNWVARSEQPIWLKSTAFCHALEGDPTNVELYEQLLSEADHKDDAFFAMIAALLGRGGGPLTSLAEPTPLHMAMLRANRWSLPDDALQSASPIVLRGIVDSPNVSLTMRLEAAERAVATGALEIGALRQYYTNATFAERTRQQALAFAKQKPSARSNALLFQLARTSSQPIGRAKILAAALANARSSDRFSTVARANAAALKSIAPVPGLDWFAAEAGRALLAAGDLERALKWLIMANSVVTQKNKLAAATLWPLLLVADDRDRVPFDAKQFIDWWQARSYLSAEKRSRQAGLLLTLVAALGRQVPPAAWAALYADAGQTNETTPSPVLLRGLRQAAETKRTGETVLLALITLGAGGPETASPATLAQVIFALQAVGLEMDARAVALEAMLAQDLGAD